MCENSEYRVFKTRYRSLNYIVPHKITCTKVYLYFHQHCVPLMCKARDANTGSHKQVLRKIEEI